MATNQFLPFAAAPGANTLTPAAYASLIARQTGFVAGVADPAQANTAWRQASTVAAMVGQFVADYSGTDANDDGNVTVLETSFRAAMLAYLQSHLTFPTAPTSSSLVHHGTDTNASVNVIACDVLPAITAYEQGALYVIYMTETNTGAVTANFNSLGSKSVLNSVGGALAAGDLVLGSEYVLVYNGTAFVVMGLVPSQIPAALPPSASPARNLVTYSTAGTGTFTVPSGVTWLWVRLVGGGGGGAGGGGGSNWAAAGGGSGGYAEGWVAVTPGQSIAYAVGAGGTGGPNTSGATGTAGGSTSFGSFMSATGGQPGSGGPPTSAGGSAGQGTGGQFASYGAPGGDGSASTNAAPGGGGGSSAFGGGGRTSTLSNGAPDGKAFGSGGGGIWGTGPSAVGGAGAVGAILISY